MLPLLIHLISYSLVSVLGVWVNMRFLSLLL